MQQEFHLFESFRITSILCFQKNTLLLVSGSVWDCCIKAILQEHNAFLVGPIKVWNGLLRACVSWHFNLASSTSFSTVFSALNSALKWWLSSSIFAFVGPSDFIFLYIQMGHKAQEHKCTKTLIWSCKPHLPLTRVLARLLSINFGISRINTHFILHRNPRQHSEIIFGKKKN